MAEGMQRAETGELHDSDVLHSSEGKEVDPFPPTITVTTGPLFSEPRTLMIEHGCMVLDQPDGKCVITFPEGTYEHEIFPRTLCERYRILLPDGFEMREVYDRFQEISQLYIVVQEQNSPQFSDS